MTIEHGKLAQIDGIDGIHVSHAYEFSVLEDSIGFEPEESDLHKLFLVTGTNEFFKIDSTVPFTYSKVNALTIDEKSELLDRSNHTGTQPIDTIDELESKLESLVPKEEGKNLSTNDFTNLYMEKVDGLESSRFKGQYSSLSNLESNIPEPTPGDYANIDEGPTLGVNRYFWDNSKNIWKKTSGTSTEMTAAQIKQEYESNINTNVFKDDDKNKLDSVSQDATKNLPDAELLSRENHTGTQLISTIEGLSDLLNEKEDTLIAGTNIKTINNESILGPGDIEIVGGGLTPTQSLKLDLIQDNATKNSSDIILKDRSNHTGTQSINTIVNLSDYLNQKVDSQAGKQLTDVNFTEEKDDKLANLESSKFKGQFTSLVELQTSYPTAEVGGYANVDEGVVEGVNRYIWDSVLVQWKKQVGASSAMTPVEVKQEYESNPDTNAFTDDEKATLAALGRYSTGSNMVYRPSTNNFRANIDLNTVSIKGVPPVAGDTVLFGDVNSPEIIILKTEGSTGTGSWVTETSLDVKDVFDDRTALALYRLNNDTLAAGGGNMGIWTGTSSYVDGKFVKAAKFDKTNSLNIPLGPEVIKAFSFTLSLDVLNRREMFFSVPGYEIGKDSMASRNIVLVNKSRAVSYSTPLVAGEFIHIVCNLEGAGDLYVNGVRQTANGGVNWSRTDRVGINIGLPFSGYGGTGLGGSVEQVRIFNRLLTQTEIDSLYNEVGFSSIEHNLNKLQDQVYVNPTQTMNMKLPVCVDNSAALSLGLIKNDMYLTPDNHVMLVY